MNLKLVAVVATLYFSILVEAVSHLHQGPRNAEAPAVNLRGTVVVDKPDGNGSPADLKRFQWSAKILRDIVFWYELHKDSIEITNCTMDLVTLQGTMLNRTDYAIGTVFVIAEDEWSSRCPEVMPDPEIDSNDQILFFLIASSPELGNDGNLKIPVQRIAGDEVIPEVVLRVNLNATEAASNAKLGDTEIMSEDRVSTSIRDEVLLRTSDRFRFGSTHRVARKVEINWGIDVGLHIQEYRWVRKKIGWWKFSKTITIGMEWDQRFWVAAWAKFHSEKPSWDWDRSIDVLPRTAVPGFGFSGTIPFVGHYSAGATVQLEALLEFKAKSEFEVQVDARYEKRHRVRIVPFTVKVSRLAPMTSPSITGKMDFTNKASGFVGLRPTIMVGVTARKRTVVGVDAAAKLGVEVQSKLKFDPHFRPYSGRGFDIGICDKCHHLRAFLDGVIKDAKVRTLLWGRVVHTVGSKWSYRRRIATLCAWKSGYWCR